MSVREAGTARAQPQGTAAPIVADPNPELARQALHAVYDLAWLVGLVLGSPWLAWRSLRSSAFRRMVLERAGLRVPRLSSDGPTRMLVHGVSVGEIKAAQALVARARETHPELEVVLCTTTDTSQEVARGLFPDLRVVRFPADPTPIVRRFFDRVRPDLVVLMELEIWPNFLRAANRRGIPVAVVNGRITERSYPRYRLFRSVFPQFNRISLFCVQSEIYASRFRRLQVDPARVHVTGNIKIDGLRVGRVEPGAGLAALLGSSDGRAVLVAGSTHAPEERMVAEAWRDSVPKARLILVPRHPERAPEVVRELTAIGLPPQRLTALRAGEEPDPSRPVIVDTIGELEAVFGLADVAFVGGSLMPHGGQNVLEPAAQGLPVLFGPHMQNFVSEVALLKEHGGCLQVADAAELGRVVAQLLTDPEAAGALGRAGAEVVRAQRGATDATWARLAGCFGL
ncbi:3-deoxy-D-manno-octulosonic acid transferase [Engelhardtia mirabilis]|uniref:3-deoxy-D-manno-octulosonic acid transferase n=1 Tax=Engelhardtia mirabilis TaxID=2528011 RepID=A0A518BLQ2_9BACT|nr:3-deoxy-D-manno-octulosonic acid transferase [Planctomycetes bacterium Pla133]QDV02234.1 3-deoxy-D-manno-octulosonic acid transferase [Planctomycetes bacterium Pla86]